MLDDQSNPADDGHSSDRPISSNSEALWSVGERIIGTQVGDRYHVRRLIGSGGMGKVYEAEQQNPRRLVALKVMQGGSTSRAAIERFEREPQVLAHLQHPGIAEVYEAGLHRSATGDVPYFAMEYIPDALDLIKYAESHRLPIYERLKLFVKVCDAVGHGHERGVVHRDLKPGNILITADGQPKIIDFGVARMTDSDVVAPTLHTDFGQLLGTLQYMSPEQYDGDPGRIDKRSDVYTLGVVLYELLCGRLPYTIRRTNVLEAARIISEQPPTRPKTASESVPRELEKVILKALEKEPQRRYPSAAALRDDILNFLNDKRVTAGGASLGYRVGKGLRRSMRARAFEWSAGAFVAAVLLTHFIGVPAVFTWTDVGHRADALMRQLAGISLTTPFEHVRIIAINDSTDLAALATQEGLEEVATSTDRRRLRALHGKLLERMARSGVKVMAVDIAFPSESPFDAHLVEGVKALDEHGIPCVVALEEWRPPIEVSSRLLTEPLRPLVRWGCFTLSVQEPWMLHLAVARETGEPMPSLALATVAAFQQPESNAPEIRMDALMTTLEIQHWKVHPESPRHREDKGLHTIPVTAFWPHESDAPEFNLASDDLVAYYELHMPEDEALNASTIAYEDVFNADPAQLQDWFSGRVALLGDFRGTTDYHLHPASGRMLTGVHAHAVGIDGMLRDVAVWMPRGDEPILIITFAAFMGVLCGLAFGRRFGVRMAVTAGTMLVIFYLCLGAYGVFQYRCNVLVPAIAFVLASELVAGVQRCRPARV